MDAATPATELSRRRIRRYSIAVPIDVVALRSGVPASIPGRTVNVSQGGVATVLAGELSPGEPVGVEFRLPLAREPIQAKAIVRHYSLMHCGLQFLAMPEEQESALRTWTQMADRSGIVTAKDVINRSAKRPPPLVTKQGRKLTKKSHGLRWAVMSTCLVVTVLAAVAWVSWSSGWHELEHSADGKATVLSIAEVPSSLMERRIIHRVDPIYPNEAIKDRIQGAVTLELFIGDDGVVRDVYAVSGPDALRPAAVDAVKWWRFEPYRLSGRAAPVHTVIAVDFRLR
jgi:TonB family protein